MQVLTVNRRTLPDERKAITHKFDIAGHEGYIIVDLFEDGQPGEIFLTIAKEEPMISGFANAFAQAISCALQYGVPLQVLVDKFRHTRFEPSGVTKNPEIRFASIVDYVFRWLELKFLLPTRENVSPIPVPSLNLDSPPCSTCGAIMIRSGDMWKCLNCDSTTSA
ncbi:MAG: hypothetical protein A3C70_01295 [Candidatus Zambryskibacteria bacterium RIFCSPHIGHO2_02_FULL_43_14]|uniref:ribonucleoside-diphosphate reductase n=1 Tax=Candidatus Zambryskibacteria bacterium RIFCSPHIGHO2_02_FULL_43_14 TaxID=1802748 RepID=A0A1G2THB9_9BACT|nr:MAG: hypothetical protein A3C70_01295 [Candidatus Zambryskibacteria bacterium RIFCSPHIGHO2_02_FULL_43_14]